MKPNVSLVSLDSLATRISNQKEEGVKEGVKVGEGEEVECTLIGYIIPQNTFTTFYYGSSTLSLLSTLDIHT